jgi:hypothetical protein
VCIVGPFQVLVISLLRISLGLRKELSEHFAREHVAFLSPAPSSQQQQQKSKLAQDLSYGNNNGPNSQIRRKFISKSSDFYDTLF